MSSVIPQGKIDDVLADPRVEYDQDDWVCIPYDDLYDLRDAVRAAMEMHEVQLARADRVQAMFQRETLVHSEARELLRRAEGAALGALDGQLADEIAAFLKRPLPDLGGVPAAAPEPWTQEDIDSAREEGRVLSAELAAASDRCLTCGSTDRVVLGPLCAIFGRFGAEPDPWHGGETP